MNDTKLKLNMRYVIHMLLTLSFMAGVSWFSNEIILEKAWNDRYFLFVGVLSVAIILCSLIEKKKIYNSIRTIAVLIACFLVSALLLLLSDFYINLPVWVLGGFIAAALVSRNIGILYLYFFVYHAIYLQGNWLNGLVFHLVVSTLIALLIPKMKSFLSMFYMMAFCTCIVVTGSVVLNKMTIDESMMLDTFYILCTYLVCIIVTMILIKWTSTGKAEEKSEEILVQDNYAYLDLLASETAEQDAAIAAITAAKEIPVQIGITETKDDSISIEHKEEKPAEVEKIDYSPYCNEKAELLMELRAKNKSFYAQAVLVGKLASETAESIGLNAELTKAAGLYKNIGKIREGSNQDSSVEIAKENNFPESLISLLDQLNHDRIEQKEAALLLITDGVISYYSVVRHVKKTDISVEKIVDTIVSKKIFQGEFNESGLSMQECYMLREKLIALLKSQDKKTSGK